jgi:signal transduction histidine kinase
MMVQERLLKNLDEKSKEIIVKEEIIKERKKVEAVLIEAKTKAELSEKLKTSFLQNMSHEIRTPMNAIVGFSQLLKEEGLSEHDRNEFIKNVTNNAESLLHLIDDILDVSKLESNQLLITEAVCDLADIFENLNAHYLSVLKNEGKEAIKLSLILPDDPPIKMTTDPVRLKQVLMKLMDNAVKFTESGEIRFGFKPEAGKIYFFVEDTGIGLSEDKKDVIFDLFRKLEENKLKLYGGTGLGLTLARYLVHLLGGEIDLESHEGFGSKFFFTLPLLQSKIPVESESELSEGPEFKRKFSGKSILIVEDTDSNFLLMERIFSHTGLSIERAVNGEVALQKFFHEGPFDLVIMDIKLPGMDGYEITRLIKEKNPKTPVIAHTAYALEGDREKSLEAGCDEYIPKPSEKEALLDTISKFL